MCQCQCLDGRLLLGWGAPAGLLAGITANLMRFAFSGLQKCLDLCRLIYAECLVEWCAEVPRGQYKVTEHVT